MEKKTFDFEAFKKDAAERLKKGETLLGRDGVFVGFPTLRPAELELSIT